MAFARRLAASPSLDARPPRPWMLDRPVHGADGRLANHHGSPV
ncbi:hypothetical protein [Shewanella putrefaciens]|nr:hypothetical protein [Shewanella putrefaciens]